MGAFIDFIFRNETYQKVLKTFEEETGKRNEALDIWLSHKNITLNDSYKFKKYLFKHIAEIKKIESWIKETYTLIGEHTNGVAWLYYSDRGKSKLPLLSYREYKYIAKHKKNIQNCSAYLENYKCQLDGFDKFVQYFYGSGNFEYDNIDGKEFFDWDAKIKEIEELRAFAKRFTSEYPKSWCVFANGKTIECISIGKLRSIEEEKFRIKEEFLMNYEKNPLRTKLIIGDNQHQIESFDNDTILKEKELNLYISYRKASSIDEEHQNICIKDEDKLKAAILDSTTYLNNPIKDLSPISIFYRYRLHLDKLGMYSDPVLRELRSKADMIQTYHKKTQNQSSITIEDYFELINPNSDLHRFSLKFENENVYRVQVRELQRNYSKGFEFIYGRIDLNMYEQDDLIPILKNKINILIKDSSIRTAEETLRRKKYQEQEKERVCQTLRRLTSAVSLWSIPSASNLPCFSLYNYYPTNCECATSDKEWETRNLIWNFKANMINSQSELKIQENNIKAADTIIPLLIRVLHHFFSSNTKELTLFCIPASKQIVTERRYKYFSDQLCRKTSMKNGYSYVKVVSDGEETHLGGTKSSEYSIDYNFFKNKFIILFDDVITRGRSMEYFRVLLEKHGAYVIGGLSIGKTVHNREDIDPINTII